LVVGDRLVPERGVISPGAAECRRIQVASR
jgi:hypothetical protein